MTKRVDRSTRSYSIESGNYQVAPSLRDWVRELGRIPRRRDVGERVQAAAVAVLRHHASPRAMAARSGFCLPLREMARRLGYTKAQMETIIAYLEGELIERVAVPDGEFRKHKTDDGIWYNDATLWRFTGKWFAALLRLHQASRRLAAMSDKFKASTIFLSIQVTNLPRRWLTGIKRKYPNLHLSGLAADCLKTVKPNRPAAPPSKLCPLRWTTPLEPSEVVARRAAAIARPSITHWAGVKVPTVTIPDTPSIAATIARSVMSRIARAFGSVTLRCDDAPSPCDVRDHHDFAAAPARPYRRNDDDDDEDTPADRRRLEKRLAKRCVNAPTTVQQRGVAVDDPGLKMALARIGR